MIDILFLGTLLLVVAVFLAITPLYNFSPALCALFIILYIIYFEEKFWFIAIIAAPVILIKYERVEPESKIAPLYGFFSIAFFQISQRLMLEQGISNDERSFILFGIEFHHIFWGAILLIFSLAIKRYRELIYFISAGFIFDEVFYTALSYREEKIYFSTENLLTGLLLLTTLTIFSACIKKHHTKQR